MGYNPLPTFLQETEELIADIEQSALALSSGEPSAETVNRLFRAFHTIKGSGAMCGLESLAAFTHHVENLLDKVRGGAVPISDSLTDLILRAADHITSLLNAAQNGVIPPGDAGESLIAAVSVLEGSGRSSDDRHTTPEEDAGAGEQRTRERLWRISFHPNPAILANGGNPVVLLREVRRLGSCVIAAHAEDVPALDAIQTDRCYFWWNIELRSACSENAIRDVFIFVEDDSRLEIEEIASAVGGAKAARELPDRAGTILTATGLKPVTKEATVRVPAERLDHLVNLVGEFVMNQACLAQVVAQTGVSAFANPIQVMERLVAELRDNVLGIRMLPIGTLFGRFSRVVHDLSAELGKEADLVTEGSETEIDKSILDQLGDPLVHCLRNCIDHGVEPAAERAQMGKRRRATVRLKASHTGSSVVISIEDDGRGIDRDAVKAKAVEKRLVAPETSLSAKEIFDLILLPGFSTAQQVTSVSGRGVGMDAVKRQIDLLHGSLALDSIEGKGTRISITLPLTLAIIDGLLVQIGRERFIIPMSAVTENVELTRRERSCHNGRNVLAVRGELIPFIDLRQIFRIAGDLPVTEKVVIVQQGDSRVGLVVGRVLGTHQTVIQSLGQAYKNIEVVSGATIMGDGEVALILDIAAIVRHADRECQMAYGVPFADASRATAAGM